MLNNGIRWLCSKLASPLRRRAARQDGQRSRHPYRATDTASCWAQYHLSLHRPEVDTPAFDTEVKHPSRRPRPRARGHSASGFRVWAQAGSGNIRIVAVAARVTCLLHLAVSLAIFVPWVPIREISIDSPSRSRKKCPTAAQGMPLLPAKDADINADATMSYTGSPRPGESKTSCGRYQ